MSIPSPADVVGPTRRRAVRPWWLAQLALIATAPLGAQQLRQAPRFEGAAVPDPPSQGRPWTPPETTLPKFLVAATGLLAEQGVADPWECEYRHVEVGSGLVVKARGFVLPERADAPGRFVVCWDGLVYPALTVGEPADLDRDVKDLAAHIRRAREDGVNRFNPGVSWGFPGGRLGFFGLAGVDDRSPIKLCLLLRLGRADLAETLFAAGTTWTPGPRPPRSSSRAGSARGEP